MDAAGWLVAAGGVAVALTALGVLVRSVYRAWKRIDAFLEDWAGEPARPGRDEVPAMPVRVKNLELHRLMHEGRLTALEKPPTS